jgi:excisionase family DNA binding protein
LRHLPSKGGGIVTGFSVPLSVELLDHLAVRVARELACRLSPPPEPYMNAAQAAEYLACDKRRIYDLAERGALSHYRDGKRLLFKRQDLDTYVRDEHPRPAMPS